MPKPVGVLQIAFGVPSRFASDGPPGRDEDNLGREENPDDEQQEEDSIDALYRAMRDGDEQLKSFHCAGFVPASEAITVRVHYSSAPIAGAQSPNCISRVEVSIAADVQTEFMPRKSAAAVQPAPDCKPRGCKPF